MTLRNLGDDEMETAIGKADYVIERAGDNPALLTKAIERIAQEEGISIVEAHKTDWGKMLLQKAVVGHRLDVTLRTANGDGEIAKASMSGERGTAPGARRHNADNYARTAQQTHNPAPQGASDGSANKACERFRALAESYSKVHSVSLDKAYTAIASTELGKMLLKQDAMQHGVHR